MSPKADQKSGAEEFFDLPWSREVLADDDGGYVAQIPELPGCFADGDSAEEVLSNLEVVMRDWLAISVDCGDSIPAPSHVGESFQWMFSVRVPRSLHEALRACWQMMLVGFARVMAGSDLVTVVCRAGHEKGLLVAEEYHLLDLPEARGCLSCGCRTSHPRH